MPNVTKLSASLRMIAGIGLLIGAAAMGYLARSPWVIAVFGAAFTVSFVTGRWSRWQAAAKAGMLSKALMGIPATFLIQCILVGILYLIGFGIGALAGREGSMAALGTFDYKAALGLMAFGGVLGLIVNLLERPGAGGMVDQLRDMSAEVAKSTEPEFPIIVEDTPITPKRFFTRYANDDQDASPAATPQELADAEIRLSVTLPTLLKQLYGLQNGGGVNDLIIVEPGETPPAGVESIFNPFSGYNDLHKSEHLQTAWDTFLNFAAPEDEDYQELFTNGTERLVVLAQWYQQTLFLDYRTPGEPRVGFVDFDHPNWNEEIRFWPDFDTFFSRLYHYEDAD